LSSRSFTTTKDRDARPAPDLVERDFSSEGPDRLWVADITYIPTWSGFLYLAVVVDAWSRKVVGWAMATHRRTELVLDALNMAVGQRRPQDVIHHSASPRGPRRGAAARDRGTLRRMLLLAVGQYPPGRLRRSRKLSATNR
jgi:putative transposase